MDDERWIGAVPLRLRPIRQTTSSSPRSKRQSLRLGRSRSSSRSTRQMEHHIGDIGDNSRKRKSIVVYRIKEPTLGATLSGPADVFRFRYPDGPHDAEALLVHPRSGDLYIVTKAKGLDSKTGVYKAASPLSTRKTTVLFHVADIPLPGGSILSMLAGRVTGGSISPDGKRVIVCDYERGWEAVVAGSKFDAVWTSEWMPLDLGSRSQGGSSCLPA